MLKPFLHEVQRHAGRDRGDPKSMAQAFWRREASGLSHRSSDERRYLSKAIEHYASGMELDYNEYYCSSNLPALLRARGARGDAERAVIVEHIVMAACERAIRLDSTDEWVWPTLLGTAFRSGNLDKAEEMADRIEVEGTPTWSLATTLKDLDESIRQTEDSDVRAGLSAVFDRPERTADDKSTRANS